MSKCKNCKNTFKPRFNALEGFCWDERCKYIEAMEKVRKNQTIQAKKSRITLKEWKLNLETNQTLMKKAQTQFNKFVRLRDSGKPCISCEKPLINKFDAGHYFSSGGHKSITFDERNCHGQCVHCNRYLHGNLLNYQIGIVKRIGDEIFELTRLSQTSKKYTKDELREIAKKYKQKCLLYQNND